MAFCEECGSEMGASGVCSKCGAGVKAQSAAPPLQQPPVQPYASPYAAPMATMSAGSPAGTPAGKKAVSKLAYALLAIFLGGIGVHKFYSGKTGLGILYLLFCWTFIPLIAGVVEGIIALTKTADASGNIYV